MHCADGTTKVLKESLALQEGEVIDASRYIFSSRQIVQWRSIVELFIIDFLKIILAENFCSGIFKNSINKYKYDENLLF